MAEYAALVADIGGTNARFALLPTAGGAPERLLTLDVNQFDGLEAAIESYLGRVDAAWPRDLGIAVAGPVADGVAALTNSHWVVDRAKLAARGELDRVRLLNDFEAVSWSLPAMVAQQALRSVGAAAAPDLSGGTFRLGVLGPGTGLGAGGLVGQDGVLAPLVAEGGHVGFAPETARQAEVRARLLTRFERISDERLVSGQGIENIYWALSREGDAPEVSAAEVFLRRESGDAIAEEAVAIFFEVLGQAAGNLALAMGAWDGVFIAGGIVQRYPDLLAGSGFREGFEAKGRHRRLMERIPTLLIEHPHPGLLGVAEAMRRG